jgi:hypothetical protein
LFIPFVFTPELGPDATTLKTCRTPSQRKAGPPRMASTQMKIIALWLDKS